jgi:hypothetical protein
MIRWAAFVFVMLTLTEAVHAQLGGLIRRGIEKGIQRKVSNGISGAPAKSQPTASPQGTAVDESDDLFSSSRARRLLALIVAVGNPDDNNLSDLTNVDEAGGRIHTRLSYSGFPEKDRELVLLTTAKSAGDAIPTNEKIKKAATRLIEKSTEDDLLLMYFVGHGFSIEQPNAAPDDQRFRSYFVAQDTPLNATQGMAEAERAAVSLDELIKEMAAAKPLQKLLIVDACRNIESENKGEYAGIQLSPAVKTRGSLWVITSCGLGQSARVARIPEVNELHPVFSWYFGQSLDNQGEADDDSDGLITIREAYRETYEKTRRLIDGGGSRLGTRKKAGNDLQVPNCLVGAGILPIVQVESLVPSRTVVSSNAEDERRITADALCRNAGQLLSIEYSRFTTRAVEAINGLTSSTATTAPMDQLGADYSLVTGYVFGNHLAQARSLQPESQAEHLLKARHLRSIGDYPGALREFKAAGRDSLDLFANGRMPDVGSFYGDGRKRSLNDVAGRTAEELLKQQSPGADVKWLLEQIREGGIVRLRAAPEMTAEPLRDVVVCSLLRVVDAREENDEVWLKVAEVEADGDLQQLEKPLWVNAREVHWFREAALMYVPGSDLEKQLSSILGSHQRNAQIYWNSSDRLQRLRNAMAGIARAQRAMAIARRFGAPIPGQVNGALGIVEGALSLAENAAIKNMRQNFARHSAATSCLDFDRLRQLQQTVPLLSGEHSATELSFQDSPWMTDKD